MRHLAQRTRSRRRRTRTSPSPLSIRTLVLTTAGSICACLPTTPSCVSSRVCASCSVRLSTRRASSRSTPPRSSLARVRGALRCSVRTTLASPRASHSPPRSTSRWPCPRTLGGYLRLGLCSVRRIPTRAGTCASSPGWIWRWPSTTTTTRCCRSCTRCSATSSLGLRIAIPGSSRSCASSTPRSPFSSPRGPALCTGMRACRCSWMRARRLMYSRTFRGRRSSSLGSL
mmetsp:Transcript_4226/g.10514  ORF Transcript_4226/g.10514 Transcript_4226/m.10514 type:complete len:229 (-) Transcript_4226:376-1062(-)